MENDRIILHPTIIKGKDTSDLSALDLAFMGNKEDGFYWNNFDNSLAYSKLIQFKELLQRLLDV